MTELPDIPTNVLTATTVLATGVAGAIGWLFKSKQAELDAANARIAALQDQMVSFLKAQVEAEPARKESLASIARAIENNSAILREMKRT